MYFPALSPVETLLRASELLPLVRRWTQECALHTLSPFLSENIEELHSDIRQRWARTWFRHPWSIVDTNNRPLVLLDRLMWGRSHSVHAVALALALPAIPEGGTLSAHPRFLLAPTIGPRWIHPEEFTPLPAHASQDLVETALVLANDGLEPRGAIRSAELLVR